MGEAVGWLSPTVTLEQAEAMRRVRNTCRVFMTRDVHEIDEEEQRIWFLSMDRYSTKPYVFYFRDSPDKDPSEKAIIVGYGLIREIDRKWYVSGGLLPDHRGRGLGRKLFGEMVDIVTKVMKKPCWLDVREDNTSARRVYSSLGFIIVDTSVDGLSATLTMRRDP